MSNGQSPEVILPQCRICASNVAVPTLSIAEIGDKPQLCVQWFGGVEHKLPPGVQIPENSQFLFPVMADPHEAGLFTAHAGARVPFLGMAKDWLAPHLAARMIEGPGGGEPDTWLIWILNPKKRRFINGRWCPMSPIIPVALLGDSICGVITPILYSNIVVRDAALSEFERLQTARTST